MDPDGRREKRGLGRGLGALLGSVETVLSPPRSPDPETAPPPTDLRLPPSRIEPNPFQPRLVFDPVKLAELAESIRTHGVLQPLIVRRAGGGYQLVSGERRWRAAQQAGLDEVPVIVRSLDDREMLEVALVENVQREDISPIEAAGAYRRLADEFELTQEEIARRVGKSRSAVANTMRLLQLPPAMQASLAEGKLTEGHARALLGIADDAARDRAWRSILTAGESVRETERIAKRSREASERSLAAGRSDAPGRIETPPRADPHLQEVEDRLRRALGTKVAIERGRGGRGIITVEFYDDDDLNRILDTLGG